MLQNASSMAVTADAVGDLSSRQEVPVFAYLRLPSVRVLLMLLSIALAALALASALSLAAPGHQGTSVGSGHITAARNTPHEIVWN